LPSIINVKEEIDGFLAKGRLNFPDEVALGRALVKVANCPQPEKVETELPGVDEEKIRAILDKATDGYLSPEENQQMLDAAGIRRAGEYVAKTRYEAVDVARKIGFPIVMKVFGPLHKSDKGGVMLNIRDTDTVRKRFDEIMQIEGAKAVILQPMLGGSELIAGVKYEKGFGHMVLAGLGGIFVEIMRDVSVALAPVSVEEAGHMIQGLHSYPLFKGIRGRAPINEQDFAEIIRRLSALVSVAPEIVEMDLNPLMASNNKITAVDSRICIRK
jgi:acetyltransferase